MAKRTHLSTKRIMIDNANSSIVIAVGIAAFLTAFSLVASRSLLAKRSYQSRVITKQEQARDQLRKNIEAVDTLKASYRGFVDRPQNIMGGNATGDSERDGDNAKIVLDALPSKYDFPALVASIEKILVDRNYGIQSINGIDDEVNQNPSVDPSQVGSLAPVAPNPSSTSQLAAPLASSGPSVGSVVDMPFELTAEGAYTSMVDLLKVFDRSIRPLNVLRLTLSVAGDESKSVQLTIQGKSFYQPEKVLNIKSEVVK